MINNNILEEIKQANITLPDKVIGEANAKVKQDDIVNYLMMQLVYGKFKDDMSDDDLVKLSSILVETDMIRWTFYQRDYGNTLGLAMRRCSIPVIRTFFPRAYGVHCELIASFCERKDCDLRILKELVHMRHFHYQRDYSMSPAFYQCCARGDIEAAKCIIDHFEFYYFDDESFYACCENGHLDMLEWLLTDTRTRAQLCNNGKELSGGLLSACEYGRVEVVKRLLALNHDPEWEGEKVDIHAYDDEPFLYAKRKNQTEILEMLEKEDAFLKNK